MTNTLLDDGMHLISTLDLKIEPAVLNLVNQWKQYAIIMIMAKIILVMDMTKTDAVMLYGICYDGLTDIGGMSYVCPSLHKT